MNSEHAAALPSRRPRAQALGMWAALVLLAAFVGYAAMRELRKAPTDAAAPARAQTQAQSQEHGAGHASADPHAPQRAALSPADERFSQALWNIHAEVRTAAVRMTFAGLTYKMGDADRASVKTKVAPLTALFAQAESDLRALETPASMQALRQRYGAALQLYGRASQEMIKVAQDGNDAHLLQAQEMSERASGILLEVGEQLWPGEIKPN